MATILMALSTANAWAETPLEFKNETMELLIMAQASSDRDARRLESQVNAAERSLERAERTVEDFENASDFAAKRQRDRSERTLQKARDTIGKIEDRPNARSMLARLSDIEARFERAVENADNNVENKDAARARLESLRASGELQRDAETLAALGKTLADALKYKIDNGVYTRRGGAIAGFTH
ncbi:MAG: hypothetical protein AAF926_01385 [Pseudomonadota bacterium]